MKKLLLILGLGLMVGTINVNSVEAQVHVSVNINVQPAWGPSGYDYAEFYYIPEINVYYDVVHQLFYYRQRGRWHSALFLPVMYSHYDFYSLYKVVINGVHYPWKYNGRHRRAYKRYCYNYAQVPIYYMRETRYHHARSNFHGWVEPRHMPRDNGRPHSPDFSKNTRNGRIGNDNRSPVNNNRPANDNRRETVNGRGKAPIRSSSSPAENGRNDSGRSGSVVGRSDRNSGSSRSGGAADVRSSNAGNESSVSTRSSSDTRSKNVSTDDPRKSDGNDRSSTRSSDNESSRSGSSKTSGRSGSSRPTRK